MEVQRGQWGSKIGFILAGTGAAIGLGNIWRFSYVAGENGGAAFVLTYLIFVIFFGIPLIIAEIAIGRKTQKNPVGAFTSLSRSKFWKFVGYFAVLTNIGILAFYSVIAGWTFGYIFKMLSGDAFGYQTFVSNPIFEIGLFAIFLIFTAGIVYGGVEKGIEKWSKILMPLLFLIMIILIIYANFLEGSSKGLEFYLKPDFSKITPKVILSAIGQAMFSLSLGMGLMVTYGSYLSKKENIFVSGTTIALLDTTVAIMAGFVIFPALFAMGGNPQAGPALVFEVLPKLFMGMPGGQIVGAFFFVLLSIAALTSTISMLEVPVSFFVDEKKINRKKIVIYATIFTFIMGIPSALSQGTVDVFTNFGLLPKSICSADFLSHMNFIFGDFAVVLGALFASVFVGWVWGIKSATEEISEGSNNFKKIAFLWGFFIKFIIPIVISLILLSLFGII